MVTPAALIVTVPSDAIVATEVSEEAYDTLKPPGLERVGSVRLSPRTAAALSADHARPLCALATESVYAALAAS